MAARRVTIEVEIDLDRYSKQAYEVRIVEIARQVAEYATDLMKDHGYTVSSSKYKLTIAYVRHVITGNIFPVRKMKLLKSKKGA